MFIRRSSFVVFGSLVAGICLCAAQLVNAANIVTTSGTAPVPGPFDAYQTVTGTTDACCGDSHRYVSYGLGPQGQEFTVPGSGSFLLTSITVKHQDVESNFIQAGAPLQLRVNSISGTTLTTLDTEILTLPSSPPANAGDYLTFHLATPVTVTGGGLYGFDIWSSPSLPGAGANTFFALDGTTTALSSGAGLANAVNYTSGDASGLTNSTDFVGTGFNRTFDVSLSAVSVPEPASIALLGFGAVLVVGAARRGRRSHCAVGGKTRD